MLGSPFINTKELCASFAPAGGGGFPRSKADGAEPIAAIVQSASREIGWAVIPDLKYGQELCLLPVPPKSYRALSHRSRRRPRWAWRRSRCRSRPHGSIGTGAAVRIAAHIRRRTGTARGRAWSRGHRIDASGLLAVGLNRDLGPDSDVALKRRILGQVEGLNASGRRVFHGDRFPRFEFRHLTADVRQGGRRHSREYEHGSDRAHSGKPVFHRYHLPSVEESTHRAWPRRRRGLRGLRHESVQRTVSDQ